MANRRTSAEVKASAARGLARTNFLAFLFLYLARRSPCDAEKLGAAWRYRALAFELSHLGAGKCGRLFLSLPPFLEASTLVCAVWPAWLIGSDPAAKVVCASGSKVLGRRHVEACRAIIQQSWYGELFPAVKLVRTSLDEIRTTRGGGRFGSSFKGGRPAVTPDVLILDEPLSITEARSAAIRGQRQIWLADTLGEISNLDPSIVLVSPRAHVDDLAGRLVHNPLWRRLELPAVGTETRDVPIGGGGVHTWRTGEPLDPEGHPVEVLARIRNKIGPAAFAARYQQSPLAIEPPRTAGGWPRYQPDELREGRRPTVCSWVFAADANGGDLIATRVVLAGEDVRPHTGRLQIIEAPDGARPAPTLSIGDRQQLARTLAGGRAWLLNVVQETVAPTALADYVKANAVTNVADHHAVKASKSGCQLMTYAGEAQVFAGHAYGLVEMSEDTARSVLEQAIARGQIILPSETAWRASIEEQLAILDYDRRALSPELMALAQALYNLQRGLTAVSLSIVIGDLSDVREDDDEDLDASTDDF